MKQYTVIQDGNKECGSACLLSIIRYYQGNVSLERLNELTNTTKEGTTFYDLSKAGMEIGLQSKGYKVDNINQLYNLEKPFISQIVNNNMTHFVVIYKVKNNKITIMDPAKGMRNLKLSDFEKMWTGYILLIEPYKKLPVYKDENYVSKSIKEVLKSNKKIITNLLVFTLLTTIFTCLFSYYFQITIDNIVYNDRLNLLVITIIFLIILFLKLSTEYLRNNLLLYLNEKIDLSIITTTIEKIIFLPYNYYKNKTTGEVISRLNDLFYLKNIIIKLLMTIFLDLLLSIITLIILFNINIKMTCLLLLLVIIYIIILLLFKPSIKRMTNISQEDSAEINSLLVESISSYETIKGLNLEHLFTKKIEKLYLKSINNSINYSRILNDQELLKDLFENIIILFITYIGLGYVMDKSITLGALITFNTMFNYFLIPIREGIDLYKDINYVKNSITRINNLVSYQSESFTKSSNIKITGDISIRNLSFDYNGKKSVINNLNLDIKHQEKVLILGPTGTGKSTLLKIIYKYYNIPRNCVFLNNYDINDYSIKDIRSNITYISQNEMLYTESIRNNIILNRDINLDNFFKVSELTYVNDVIKDKPFGYDYILEENGANLSGGQKQRIVLARALLKESSILLIDEGLNEIDINLERKILKNIFKEYNNKTIIIISHRKDNIDLYDKVIYLDEGKVREELTKNE